MSRWFCWVMVAGVVMAGGCCLNPPDSTLPADPPVAVDDKSTSQPATSARHGSVEVTARLLEVPDGAIVRRQLYNYATVLKYEVVQVHRGQDVPKLMYVAHYNPYKPRQEASDKWVSGIGGNLLTFEAGQLHRLCLEPSADQHYLGGLINLYFDQAADDPYWAVHTDLAP